MLVGVLISLLAGSGLALAGSATGCRINPDSDDDWPAWPPILTDQLGDLILPNQVQFSKNKYRSVPELRSSSIASFSGTFDLILLVNFEFIV